ncbi:MAG TPA: HAD family hydrolase [Candidatus Sulfotelmatobacter sp.]|jgi:phosphoglycolate phosphatase-like HAD superfamily hydrolase|nr:HAD family hydrolase [Candidatus Sulfotelmatobacter sp.]
MSPTLVLFDVDGTLVNTAGAGRRALERSFREVFGLSDIAEPASRVRFNGKSDPTIIADIAREAGIPGASIERRYPELQRAYLDALRAELRSPDPRRAVLPGVVPLLEILSRRDDVTLGLITGNIEEGARAKLSVFDLNRFFPDGGFASDHPERAEIARIAHERLSRRVGLRFPPERVVVVGDTELDVACARANGFVAIAVESPWMSRDELEASAPDGLFRDLTDADAVLRAMRID